MSPANDLERGRAAYASRAWRDAFDALANADHAQPLDDADLELLGWSAGLSGHDEDMFGAFERLHRLRSERGDHVPAARAAFWLGFRLLFLGEMGRGTGWIAQAHRSLEHCSEDCVERGYLRIPETRALIVRDRNPAAGLEVAATIVQIADRFHDEDLASIARMLLGQAHIALGAQQQGLASMDEAMLVATTGRLSPMVTGLVYCAVISSCQNVYALDRAREWTAVLSAWCESQPQLAAFNGKCRVHRAEILQLQGDWEEAITEAHHAVEPQAPSDVVGAAQYQEAEIRRLRGEFAEAEGAYRQASRHGRDPQPGLALLRLAQNNHAAAAAQIRAALEAARDPLVRTRYLPAAVEILLASGDHAAAGDAARELAQVADTTRNEIVEAMAAHAAGAVRLACGDAEHAIEPLRRSFAIWQRAGAPYLAARIRMLIGVALGERGDDEGAELEREAAREVFRSLHAAPDLARLEQPGAARNDRPFGLTPRELEVLRLVASGRTNRAISQELFLSEKTVDRHVSNIFTKLDVSTRAAATAFAFQHKLN